MSKSDPLLDLLARLESLTVVQRAMVFADAVGVFAGAHSRVTGESTEQSIEFILNRMQEQADKAQLMFPVN